MGGKWSRHEKSLSLSHISDSINEVAFPDYYIDNVVVTDEDIMLASRPWKILISGENTLPYLTFKAVKSKTFKYTSSLAWFYSAFYGELFKISPDTEFKFVFADLGKQYKENLVNGLIESLLIAKNDRDVLHRALFKTVKNKSKGVRISRLDYVMMGEALFWAFELVIGSGFEDERLSWIRIYSHMLSVILPMVPEYRCRSMKATNNSGDGIIPLMKISAMNSSQGKIFPMETVAGTLAEEVVVEVEDITNIPLRVLLFSPLRLVQQ
eukprot:gene44376-59215_t